jgi:SAM-dependent methyltransferase
MVGSSLNEWNINPDPVTLAYHLKQWEEPYRSTVHFADFLEHQLEGADHVVDLACGSGGPTWYLANRFPATKFLGLDVSEELIGHARRSRNLDFEIDDAENLNVRFGVDGVVGMQMLHTMPDPGLPIHQIATRLRPQWMAFSTLIYEGNINCKIVVSEPQRPRMSYYNIYGLPGLVYALGQEGYQFSKYKKFNIDMDLPKPDNPDLMGTYTINTETSKLQCSGPLILPWGFVLFERRQYE